MVSHWMLKLHVGPKSLQGPALAENYVLAAVWKLIVSLMRIMAVSSSIHLRVGSIG